MRQQIDQYLRRKSDNHPEKGGFKSRFFSFSFNFINVEHIFSLKYFKEDLIFISGLFFMPNLQQAFIKLINLNCNPNQIMWEQSCNK